MEVARWLANGPSAAESDADTDDASDSGARAEVDADFFAIHGIDPPQPLPKQTDDEETPCAAPEIWPDNQHIVRVWLAMQTQWRVGFSGATGLDYAVLPVVMRGVQVPLNERMDIFAGVQVMERTTLKVWNAARIKREGQKTA